MEVLIIVAIFIGFGLVQAGKTEEKNSRHNRRR